MDIREEKDESLLKMIVTLIPALAWEFLKRDGSKKPSDKPKKEPWSPFKWLDPHPGAGVSHNPS